MSKEVVYTEEVVNDLVEAYTKQDTDEARAAVVAEWAEQLGVSEASVRAKLVAENVYIAKTRTTKNGEPVETKAKIVGDIASMLGVNEERIESLEKATKPTLKMIREALEAAAAQRVA